MTFNCDAVTYDGTLSKATEDALVPAHTMDEVVTVLKHDKVTFKRQRDSYTFPAPDRSDRRLGLIQRV